MVDYDALQRVLGLARQEAREIPAGYEANAVCLLLFDHPETTLLAVQKADNEGYPWRNQVALAGGRIDTTDRNAAAAALRELHEELGIAQAEVNVLGSLGHFQTLGSKNDLEAIVGHWKRPSRLRFDRREIEQVLKPSLNDLITLHVREGFRSRLASQIGDALVYALPDARIWGVTARILHEFTELVLDHEIHVQSSA